MHDFVRHNGHAAQEIALSTFRGGIQAPQEVLEQYNRSPAGTDRSSSVSLYFFLDLGLR